MLEYSPVRQWGYYLLFFVMLVLLVPQAGLAGDEFFWLYWSNFMAEHGLANAYQDPGDNYNPFYQYVLWAYGQLMGSQERIEHYVHFLKAFTLVFDFAGAIWAASLVAERNRRFELSLLLLFNIGYLYNTLAWNQIDAIYTLWSFGAVVLAVRGRLRWSAVFYALALCTKTQAIIFLPPLLLLWAPLAWQRPGRAAQALGVFGLLILLVLAPFIWLGDENYLPRILEINVKAASFYPNISMNAYNFWHLVMPADLDLTATSDESPFWGLTCKAWGLLLFCAGSAAALMPLLLYAIRSVLAMRRHGREALRPPSFPLVLLCVGLIPLLFAFFNTEMHERYWHPALLFLGAYGLLTRRYWPYVLVSVGYYLNLEAIMKYLQLKNYHVLLFTPWFVATLFGLALALAFWQLYARVWRHEPRPGSACAPEAEYSAAVPVLG